MPDQDNYILGRDYCASVRLNTQHALWLEILGYLLHPSIPLAIGDPQGLSIIDVGTGTGNWLFGVHQQLKTPFKQLVGADISDAQFPHKAWLPENVKLITLDALDPNGPPEELREQFNIVNARYLCSLVKDRPDQLLDFFSKLVKPGGYLQWGEPYNCDLAVESVGGPAEGLNFIVSRINATMDSAWLDLSDKDMNPFGFEIIAMERRKPHPWHRRSIVDNWCMLMDEFTPRLGWSAEEVKEMNQKAVIEAEEGSYINVVVQNVVARKRGSNKVENGHH